MHNDTFVYSSLSVKIHIHFVFPYYEMRRRRTVCVHSAARASVPLSAPRLDFSCLHCTVKDPAESEGALPLTTERREIVENLPLLIQMK